MSDERAPATLPRVGLGYDVHRLAPGRRLLLGGVELAHPMGLGLEGHSDADVLTHAIIDALLGAAGLADIGHLFPPDDDRFRGASSLGLLDQTRELLGQRGWRVGNVDATVVTEAPRLADHLGEMRERLARALGVSADAIGVQAKTNERLDDLGRGEGIAAWAVALIWRGR